MRKLDEIADETVRGMVEAALEEDDLTHERGERSLGFDAAGFGNFFPEHTADEIKDAWWWYREIKRG
jgi:hypothetical protein